MGGRQQWPSSPGAHDNDGRKVHKYPAASIAVPKILPLVKKKKELNLKKERTGLIYFFEFCAAVQHKIPYHVRIFALSPPHFTSSSLNTSPAVFVLFVTIPCEGGPPWRPTMPHRLQGSAKRGAHSVLEDGRKEGEGGL